MDINKFLDRTKRTFSDNSPVILTAIGVTGTITTAYLAAKASFKASKKLNDAKFVEKFKDSSATHITALRKEPLTGKQKFKLVWPLYVPTVATGAMTCTCIIAANYIGTKRAAALAAAYTLSQEAVSEYKAKVIEHVGKDEEAVIREELARDRVNRNPPTGVIVGTGQVLCHDARSSRYFMSSKNAIEKAQNEINYQINRSDHAALTEFYEKIGLEPTSESDDIGWNSETNLELLWATVESPDGIPCLSFDFATVPQRNFVWFRN